MDLARIDLCLDIQRHLHPGFRGAGSLEQPIDQFGTLAEARGRKAYGSQRQVLEGRAALSFWRCSPRSVHENL